MAVAGEIFGAGQNQSGAEVSLAHSGYNLKRALAVVGLAKLLAALKNFRAGGRRPAAGRGPSTGKWLATEVSAGRRGKEFGPA